MQADFDELIHFFDVLEANVDPRSKAAQRLVEETSEDFIRAVDNQTSAAWDYIVDRFYPPPRRGKIRWTSAKQRRWFWWARSKGLITVPYKRTFKLLRATEIIPVEISSTGFSLLVSIDEKIAPYARFVVGDRQQRFHADTGWKPIGSPDLLDNRAVTLITDELGFHYENRLNGALFGRAD